MKEFREDLHADYGQWFSVERVLFEARTDHQHLVIFENAEYGRVMALDGVVQTTERDEFVYHEMLAHVPILAHGSARRVLIVGGGDGGMLREVCVHGAVAEITQVEIDREVIDLCRRYLPNHSRGAFDDPRLDLVIGDGVEYARNTDRRFDVIISDSTDPIGPGEVLFSAGFYGACKRCLNPGGILVTQNGCPFEQLEEITDTAARMGPQFQDQTFYAAAVPTYTGGIMAFGWGTDDRSLRQTPVTTLERRYAAAGLETRYYTPALHRSAFDLPRYVLDAIG